MSKSLKLRLRCAFHSSLPVIDYLTPDSTLENLFEVVASAADLSKDEIKILNGESAADHEATYNKNHIAT